MSPNFPIQANYTEEEIVGRGWVNRKPFRRGERTIDDLILQSFTMFLYLATFFQFLNLHYLDSGGDFLDHDVNFGRLYCGPFL
jgi:hypothetical protein